MLTGRIPRGSFAKTISKNKCGSEVTRWTLPSSPYLVNCPFQGDQKLKFRMEECECYCESGSEHEKDESQRNCFGLKPSKCFNLQAVTSASLLHFLYLDFIAFPHAILKDLFCIIKLIFSLQRPLHLVQVFDFFFPFFT